jgi:hypothetical protein
MQECMMKVDPEKSSRTKSLAAVIVTGLVGIGLLVFLSMSGVAPFRDTRTDKVHDQNIVGKTGSD